MANKRKAARKKTDFYGWMLFILCAIFFLASAVKNRDFFAGIGSLIFLGACFLFLLPSDSKDETRTEEVADGKQSLSHGSPGDPKT